MGVIAIISQALLYLAGYNKFSENLQKFILSMVSVFK